MPSRSADPQRSLTVTLGGRPYPLRVSDADEEPIRKIAKELNDKLTELQRSYPDHDKQDCLSMLLLIYSVDLYKVKGGETTTAAMPSARSDEKIVQALQSAEEVLTRALTKESAPYSALSVET